MLTKPPFLFAARPMNAAKRGYSTYSTTYGFNGVSHRWGGRECTDQFIQLGPPQQHLSRPIPGARSAHAMRNGPRSGF